MDYGGGSQKKLIDIMRFTHIDINFAIKCDGDQKPSKCTLNVFLTNLVTFIFYVKIDVNMCEPYYVNIFFVNPLHSPCV